MKSKCVQNLIERSATISKKLNKTKYKNNVDKPDDKLLLTLQCFEEIRGFYFSVHRHYIPLSLLDFARKE